MLKVSTAPTVLSVPDS